MEVMVWSKLPKKDKKHLRESNILYKWQFEQQVKFMKERQEENPDRHNVVCWECRKIADKLGLWNFHVKED